MHVLCVCFVLHVCCYVMLWYVVVYDMIGHLVNIDKMNKGNKMEIHLKGASTGIYFVRIHKDNTKGRTIKLNKVLY